jgi:hypothetical protein
LAVRFKPPKPILYFHMIIELYLETNAIKH